MRNSKKRKWELTKPAHRKEWAYYAKDYLRRELHRNPREYTNAQGEKVMLSTLLDVYKHVCEVPPSVGKNWGTRSPMSLTDISSLNKAFPDLMQKVDEVWIMSNYSEDELRKERDDLVRGLRKEIHELQKKQKNKNR